ncbi:MAG: PKD domain-containing protein, partial [Actinomycetota bacterium]|nr:PKD domain-containing protein [Actinomycetota bacterium]
MPILTRALALLACCLPLALPAVAHGALTLSHVKAEAVEVEGNGDDVVGPGERIELRETVGTATALNGASAMLFSPTPGVNLNVATANYANAPAGGQSTNTRPFDAVLGGNLTCGANMSFGLTMEAGADTGAVAFTVPTGAPGPVVASQGPTVPVAQEGETNAPLTIATAGRVKGMEVRIGSLTHPDLSQLRLELVAPDGHKILLADAGSLKDTADLNAMANTVFAAEGVPVSGGDAPYGGGFEAEGDLGQLEGRALNGTWQLRVTDVVAGGGAGALDAWGLDHRRAYCSGIPKAAFDMSVDPPRVDPGGFVSFDGSSSNDSGGEIKKYEWDLDGDGEFDDASTPQIAPRQYPDKAKVPIRLRVTDDDGLTDVETQNLAVTLPPAAAIGAAPLSPETGETVRLSAAGSSDPDGALVNYRWTVEDGEVPVSDTQGANFLDTAFLTAGKKKVTVTVTDDDGAEATKSMEVTVRNRAPVAHIALPARIDAGRAATLDASGSSDPEGAPLAYHWDLDGDPATFETSSNGLPKLDHAFATHGTRTIRLRVTDDWGSTATATATFTVTRAPVAVVNATPNPVSLRNAVTVSAAGSSDPDAPAAPLAYEWDVDGDADDDFAAGGVSVTTSWATAATRTVKVRVTDSSGAQTVGSVDVVVRNMLPVATLTAAPAAPTAGQATTLTAVGSDPDGTVAKYEWDRDGDGFYELDTGATPSTTATFANAGNVTVRVKVTDNDSGTGTKALVVPVAPVPDTGGGDGDGDGTPPPPGG